MSPVIRLSNELFERLESHAVGFDSPSGVIERVLNYYEVHSSEDRGANNRVAAGTKTIIPRFGKQIGRKVRDKEKERRLKLLVGKNLNWGDFEIREESVLYYRDEGKKVLCKYSSFSTEQKRWFYGVPERYWSDWDDNFYLAFILGGTNDDDRFLLLKPSDAITLFDKCSLSHGERKINLRIYQSDGKIHIQEWREYEVENHLVQIK